LGLIFFLVLVAASPGRTATNPSDLGSPGSWIDRMTAALWPTASVKADVSLESSDEIGRGLDTEMLLVRRQRGAEVATQIRVIKPDPSVGTVYEVSSTAGKPIERWVYLPAVRRLRNLVGTRRTDSFMGSEFSYEDLDIAAPLESEWKSVERIEENGRSLVRVTSAPYSSYERVEIVIDPATSLPVSASYYDRDGSLFKRATFGEIQTVDAHPMPTRIEIDDVQTGAKSVLRLRNIRLQEPIDEKTFTESPIRMRRAKP
jgi:Outer membrane lipoprotein-sorting protein